jgi:SAM-dependent methyltransferase
LEILGRALAVLTPVLDIVSSPVEEPEPPGWCVKRGWTDFLSSLSDDALTASESKGLESGILELSSAPHDFRELFEEVWRVTRLPREETSPFPIPAAALRGVPGRKREQLGTLLGALAPLAERAERIVDVGAGSGHFSRLSAELFRRKTVALDRDASRLQSGSARSEERSREVGLLDLAFVKSDLSCEQLELGSTDLAVGLHACGELGDRLVLAAARAGCDLALISCCLQKIQAPERLALSCAAGDFRLRRADLGLTNLTLQAEGVERTLADNLRAREVRLALRRLLRERGLDVAAGEEMRGVNRRRALAGLAELSSRVLSDRGLPPATAAELEFHARNARRDYAAMRRFTLPRHLLARLVELTVVFDRAACLSERGLSVRVAELFERGVTPRNSLLLASANPRHLRNQGRSA